MLEGSLTPCAVRAAQLPQGWACAVPAPAATQLTGRLGATPSLSSRPARPPLQSASSARCAARAAAILARQHLCDCGFDAPEWSASPSRQPRSTPRPLAVQGLAATRCPCLRQARVRDAPFLTLHASRALLLSQAGPFAARAFDVTPTRDDVTIPSALFRVLLLLPLPGLPLAPRRRSCRGQLDPPLGSCPPGPCRWSTPLRESAGRLAPGLPATSASQT